MDRAGSQNDRVLDQFTRQAEGYARLTSQPRDARPSPMLALLGLTADDVALDVACGAGSLALQIALHVRHVTGIDLTPAMLDQARAAQAERGIANIDWRTGDSQALPFADGSFSITLCRAAFHHLDRPATVLAEMRRVSRGGGRIAVIDFGFPDDKAAAFDALERRRDPSHVHAHTLAELRALGRDAGLAEQIARSLPSSELPFEAVLATSHPDECPREEIGAAVHADAVSGANRLGLSARLGEDGRTYVAYPQAIVVWTR